MPMVYKSHSEHNYSAIPVSTTTTTSCTTTVTTTSASSSSVTSSCMTTPRVVMSYASTFAVKVEPKVPGE